jgi:hypothetical protein
VFVDLARAARTQGVGVWAHDATPSFSVADAGAVGPQGALVLPKLFRRVIDYLRTRTGPDQTLPAWLSATPEEDDQVLLPSGATVALSSLLRQTGDTVTLAADVLDLVFVER